MRIRMELDIDVERTSMSQLIQIVEALESVEYHDYTLVEQPEEEQ